MAGRAPGDPAIADAWLHVDVAVEADGGAAVLSVRGEIDVMTAPVLDQIVAAVIDHGAAQLVVDASGVEFMDCSGLRVVVAAASRLGRDGSRLVIRSPSTPVIRLLDMTGVAAVVRMEHGASSAPARQDEQALARALTQVAAIPVGSDMLEATLTAVVALAAATIVPAHGVSVTLLRYGHFVTAAATDDTIRSLDEYQYDVGQGPCVDAATQGHRFQADSLEVEQRWPAFTPYVIEQGFHSMMSTPLVTSSGPAGALNLYSRSSGAFDIGQQALASLFAAQASTVVSHAGVELAPEQIVKRLRAALQAREVIAQAQGALMAQTGATADEVHAVLRRRSQSTSTPLVDEARLVIASTQSESRA